MHPTIDIAVRPSPSLRRAELDEIWALTERYVDTDRERYESRLLALPEVGLWRVRGGELDGLVSLDVYTTEWQGRHIRSSSPPVSSRTSDSEVETWC